MLRTKNTYIVAYDDETEPCSFDLVEDLLAGDLKGLIDNRLTESLQ